MTCAVWINKEHVLLLSTYAFLRVELGPLVAMLMRVGPVREYIDTLHVHLEYTTFMYGVGRSLERTIR
jgi:hypothetical protein